MSLARAGGCVAEASIVHPCTRAPMYVGRINATHRVAVGSCNTMHILCMVTCTGFIDLSSEPYHPVRHFVRQGMRLHASFERFTDDAVEAETSSCSLRGSFEMGRPMVCRNGA